MLASLLARPAYLDLPQDIIAGALAGRLHLASGADVHDRSFLYFHRHGANEPGPAAAAKTQPVRPKNGG